MLKNFIHETGPLKFRNILGGVFVTVVNGFRPLANAKKNSILDATVVQNFKY